MRRTLAHIAKVFVEVFIASHATAPKEIMLACDATNDPVHGNKKIAAAYAQPIVHIEMNIASQTISRKCQ